MSVNRQSLNNAGRSGGIAPLRPSAEGPRHARHSNGEIVAAAPQGGMRSRDHVVSWHALLAVSDRGSRDHDR
jgi:hypothetical protein